MARYWIRNRGRVQGPFSEERIQGLLRRGRFNRHFHVSEDRKNWYPASEFPEFFAGSGGPEPAEDESPFSSGGSPFDDDSDEHDEPPAAVPTAERKRRSSSGRRRRPRDEEEDDYDDEEDDDEGEDLEDDDEDWEDDDYGEGVIPRFIGWIERNVIAVGVVLLVVLGALSYVVFFREDFTQDIADMEALLAVQSKLQQASAQNIRADEWMQLTDSTSNELAPLITRLEAGATAMDMVKQELLFIARDEFPKMFKELPAGEETALNRVRIRFSLVDQMIQSKIRWHDGTALMQRPQAPPQQQPPAEHVPPGQDMPPEQGQQPGSELPPNSGSPTGQQLNSGQANGQQNFNSPQPGNQLQPVQ